MKFNQINENIYEGKFFLEGSVKDYPLLYDILNPLRKTVVNPLYDVDGGNILLYTTINGDTAICGSVGRDDKKLDTKYALVSDIFSFWRKLHREGKNVSLEFKLNGLNVYEESAIPEGTVTFTVGWWF